MDTLFFLQVSPPAPGWLTIIMYGIGVAVAINQLYVTNKVAGIEQKIRAWFEERMEKITASNDKKLEQVQIELENKQEKNHQSISGQLFEIRRNMVSVDKIENMIGKALRDNKA